MGPGFELINDCTKTFVACPRCNILLQRVIRVGQHIAGDRETRDDDEECKSRCNALEDSPTRHDIKVRGRLGRTALVAQMAADVGHNDLLSFIIEI